LKRIILSAAAATLVGLTACSNSAGHAAAPGNAPVPVSCSQQYRTWEQGKGTGLIDALQAVSVATTAGNAKVLAVTLKKARPAVARAARYPVPACADPRGYWSVLLMHVNAAVASTGSVSSARTALKGVPEIEKELTAEIQATAR
jgi:ABC-type phosphate/phosphonate transport system substrate-binding protein